MSLGIALTLAGLGAQAFGTAKSAQENEAWRNKLLERSDSLDAAFNKEYNMDYMQTPGVKNMMASYGQGLKDINKNVEGRAAMAGASPESVIAEREAVNQNYGDFTRKVASGQDAYRADKERMYMMRRDALDDRIFTADKEKAGQWANLMKSGGSLATAGVELAGMDKGESTADLLKRLLAGQGQAISGPVMAQAGFSG